MLGTRVLSALVLVPLVLAGLYFSPLTTALLTGVAAVLGTNEFYTMASNSRFRFRPLALPGYALALAFSLAGFVKRVDLMLLAVGLLAIYALLTLGLRHRIEPSLETGKYGFAANWGMTLFPPTYVGLPLGLITLIRARFDGTNEAYWWVLIALLATWGADTGGYFAGRAFGRHKLAPKISPKKTVEGAIGGIIAGTIGVVIVGTQGLSIEAYICVLLGIVLCIASIIGDLFESWVKRRFEVKDSGKLIPGHGGLLDRIDSFLVVALLTYVFIAIYR